MPDPQPNSRKAKPTEADKQAAARLLAIWNDAVAQSKADPTRPNLTQDTVGEELGVTQSSVSQYLNGLIPLNYKTLLVFSSVLAIDPHEIRNDLPEQKLGQRIGETTADYNDWVNVVGYAQAVGLGSGAEAQEYAETHKLKFRNDSLRRKGLRPAALAVYYGHGDSMEPRIKAGDAILFDTSDTTPADDAIFIVQSNGEIHAKRCEIIEGAAYFRSDNPPGDHSWRKPRRMDNPQTPITVVGRVRWIGSWED